MSRPRTASTVRSTVATAAVLALSVGLVPAVSAQSAQSSSGSSDAGSVVSQLSVGSVTAATYAGSSVPLGSVLGGLDDVGSADFTRPGGPAAPARPVSTRDPSITTAEVRAVTPLYPGSADPQMRRAEVWTVTSAAMQREVRVEVYRAPDGVSGPMVYFLDGVGSSVPSGWSGNLGFNDPAMRARELTVVAPTGAPASMWADWNSDDPILGPNKWETFLTRELPPLVKARVANNGHWGALGVSMGAGPAVHLAQAHPDMFDAAGGVSGCYSTTSQVGYQNVRLTVENGGGSLENLWGPRGSADWLRNDTEAQPESLRGKRLYLSTATGLIGATDLLNFGTNGSLLAEGHLLEKGTYECTRSFERTLADEGIEAKVDYAPTGIHNWPVFTPRMADALDHMVPGLGPVTRAPAPAVNAPELPRFGS